MTDRCLDDEIQVVRRFSEASFPSATLVLLGGSWARGEAHAESDLDVVIVDDTLTEVRFQGRLFESRLLGVCALPWARIDWLFGEHRKSRTAPVASQLVDAMVVSGDPSLAREMQRKAIEILRQGPMPLTESERQELRWELTGLLLDLAHAPAAEAAALAAQCHTALLRASLDAVGAWRGDRKHLRRSLLQVDESLAVRLDRALVAACTGDRGPLLEIGNEVLAALGGPLRTYDERF